MSAKTKPMKAQAALDFMSAYGLVFIVLAIISYVIFHFMFANQALAPTYCNAAPSFSCVAFALNRTGSFTVLLAGDRRHHNNKRRSLFGFGQRHRRLAAVRQHQSRQIHRGSAVLSCQQQPADAPHAVLQQPGRILGKLLRRQRLCQGLSGHHDDRLPLAELHLLQPAKHHEHDTADHTILRQVQLNAQVRAEGPQGRPTKTKLMYALKL